MVKEEKMNCPISKKIETLQGKYAKDLSCPEMIDELLAAKIEKAKVEDISVYSPLSCKNVWGICQKCYGRDTTEGA